MPMKKHLKVCTLAPSVVFSDIDVPFYLYDFILRIKKSIHITSDKIHTALTLLLLTAFSIEICYF